MPVRSSSTDPKIYSHMNVDEFFNYLKERFNETFANFICKELQIISPSVLGLMTIKELGNLTRAMYPDLKPASKEYYTGDHAATNGNHELKLSIMALIQLLKKEFSYDHRNKRKGNHTTTTTSSEISESEVHVNKTGMNLSNDKLNGKRKCRRRKAELSNSSRNIEWSFSSDEYQLPSLEELYPTEGASAQERADFELLTHGRIDYFSQKYLYLTDIIETRHFQHYAQIQMSMHKENLYEFFHFIRHRPDLLNEIQALAKELKMEEPFKKHSNLVDRLIKMKTKSNFVNVGYEPR